MDHLIKWLPTVIPSLILFYAFSAGPLPAYRYHETFGGGDYYLDLYYDVNPRGYFQKNQSHQKIRFRGFFINGQEEEKVNGYLIRRAGVPSYEFDSSRGRFQGNLKSSPSGCEPELHFRLEKPGRAPASGVLPAGFCS